MDDILRLTQEAFELNDVKTKEVNSLVLAYVGDAVYELVIRTMDSSNPKHVNKLNKESVKYVNAHAQAMLITAIKDDLTEEEFWFYNRGKNTRTKSSSKNAGMKEYHMATGFEALVGHLYLSHQTERMLELIKLGISRLDAVK